MTTIPPYEFSYGGEKAFDSNIEKWIDNLKLRLLFMYVCRLVSEALVKLAFVETNAKGDSFGLKGATNFSPCCILCTFDEIEEMLKSLR